MFCVGFFKAGKSRQHTKMILWGSGCGLALCLAGFGSHIAVNGVAERRQNPSSAFSKGRGACLGGHPGPMLGHPGAGLGPGWVLLGAFWAMQPRFGALREAFGRHLEANAGLGSSDMEHPCGKMAMWPKLQKHIENSMFFGDFLEAGGARRHAKMRLWSFGGRH